MEHIAVSYGGTTLHRILVARNCVCYVTNTGVYYFNEATGLAIGEALLSNVIAGCANKYGIYLATSSAIYKLPLSSLVSLNSTADLVLVFDSTTTVPVTSVVDIDGADTALIIATSTTLVYAPEAELDQAICFTLTMSGITRCKINYKLIVIVKDGKPLWIFRNRYHLDLNHFTTSGEYLTPEVKTFTEIGSPLNLSNIGLTLVRNIEINQEGYILMFVYVLGVNGLVLARIINSKVYILDVAPFVTDTSVACFTWVSDSRAILYTPARLTWIDLDFEFGRIKVKSKTTFTDTIYPISAIYKDNNIVVMTTTSTVITITNLLSPKPAFTHIVNSSRYRFTCVSSDRQYIASCHTSTTTILYLCTKAADPSTAYSEVFSRDIKLDVPEVSSTRGLIEYNGWLIAFVTASVAPTSRALKYQKVDNSWVYIGPASGLDNVVIKSDGTKKLQEGLYSVTLTSDSIIVSIDSLTGEPVIEQTFLGATVIHKYDNYYAIGSAIWGDVPEFTEDTYAPITDIALGEDIFLLVPSVGIYAINTTTMKRTLLNITAIDMTSIDVTSLATSLKGLLAFGKDSGISGQIAIETLGGI